jgi:adenylate kinase
LRAIVDSGGLVSDEITNAVVAERLTESDCVAGFLLDGYPRTLQQVEALDDFLASSGQSLDAVISLLADVDEVVDRLLKRAEVEGRSDDTVDTIRRRQAIYRRETEPLLEVYRDRGLLVEVDGLGAVEDVSARLFAALDSRSNELATQ